MSHEYNEPLQIGTFSVAHESFPGLVFEGAVIDLRSLEGLAQRLGFPTGALRSTDTLLATWRQSSSALQVLVGLLKNGELASAVRHAPRDAKPRVPFTPGQIYCTAANYYKQLVDLIVRKGTDRRLAGLEGRKREAMAREMVEKRALEGEPYLFVRPASTIMGPNDPIVLPRDAERVGWELELAAVIGTPARHVSRDRALAHVAGYTIVNDVTQSDWIARPDFPGADWLASKGAPNSFPIGPYLVAAAAIPDPQRLEMTLTVNGKVMQSDTTADMVSDVARQIEYLSNRVQLRPGDIIATGTPAGTAAERGVFLRAGDLVESTISGLGTQRNQCVMEEPSGTVSAAAAGNARQ